MCEDLLFWHVHGTVSYGCAELREEIKCAAIDRERTAAAHAEEVGALETEIRRMCARQADDRREWEEHEKKICAELEVHRKALAEAGQQQCELEHAEEAARQDWDTAQSAFKAQEQEKLAAMGSHVVPFCLHKLVAVLSEVRVVRESAAADGSTAEEAALVRDQPLGLCQTELVEMNQDSKEELQHEQICAQGLEAGAQTEVAWLQTELQVHSHVKQCACGRSF